MTSDVLCIFAPNVNWYAQEIPFTSTNKHQLHNMVLRHTQTDTYDHRVWKTGLPVRSAVLKPHAGELVVGWVTTSESSLLYVFCFDTFLFDFNSFRNSLLSPYCLVLQPIHLANPLNTIIRRLNILPAHELLPCPSRYHLRQ